MRGQEGAALHQEEIQKAVLVVVDPSQTGAGLVHDVLHGAAAVEMLEINPGRFGDVDKVDADSWGKLEGRLLHRRLRLERRMPACCAGFCAAITQTVFVWPGRQPDCHAKGDC